MCTSCRGACWPALGAGEVTGAGITMPGECTWPTGVEDDVGACMTLPGLCSWPAVGDGDEAGAGITIPGICVWPAGIALLVVLLTFARRAEARRRIFRFGFRLSRCLSALGSSLRALRVHRVEP